MVLLHFILILLNKTNNLCYTYFASLKYFLVFGVESQILIHLNPFYRKNHPLQLQNTDSYDISQRVY